MFGKKKKQTATPEISAVQPVQEAPAQEAPPAETPEKPEKPEKLSRRAKKQQKQQQAEEQKRREEERRRIEDEVRKEAEKKYSRPRFADFFAFTILLLAAVLLALGPVLKLILEQTGGAEAMTTVSTVAQYCLLAAIAIPAWCFVYKKKFIWKIVFFVALAVFIGGSILGLTL